VPEYFGNSGEASIVNAGQEFAKLKILLKTKNQPDLLRWWIEHHAAIVGLDNLIIFDNGSDDPRVWQIYSEYTSKLCLRRFSGFVDYIHSRKMFGHLYRELNEICAYHVFLDTDEFLIFSDGKKAFCDEAIVKRIDEREEVLIYPATWLQNVLGRPNVFGLGNGLDTLIGGLHWGKPIVSARAVCADIMMHNIQALRVQQQNRLTTNFFCLHRSLCSAQQRILANIDKLIAQGVLPTTGGIDEALECDIEDPANRKGRRYLTEIHKLHGAVPDAVGSTHRSLTICRDGSFEFDSLDLSDLVEQFVLEPDDKWLEANY
jgi:hypothetical protein